MDRRVPQKRRPKTYEFPDLHLQADPRRLQKVIIYILVKIISNTYNCSICSGWKVKWLVCGMIHFLRVLKGSGVISFSSNVEG